ncbi:MAG: thiamine-phosphate kinase [Desulfococcaceae bacterium]
MNLKELGEFGFIERASANCLIRRDGVTRGIGDDAAAFAVPAGELILLTSDMLVEGVHFLRKAASPEELGAKALAVNLSDIAAMGGTAREAFVSLGVPSDVSVDFLDGIYRGMRELAREFHVNILGGDTTGSGRDLILSITVTGSVKETEMLRRDAARPGDRIVCTGHLGDSRAGLHLILNEVPAEDPVLEALRSAHIRPRPHLREGRFLAESGETRAAIDVSDGLGADLGHILRESGVGGRVCTDSLPISDALREFCRRFDRDPVREALAGGEDYVLVATVAAKRAEFLAKEFRERFEQTLFVIGEITEGGELLRVDANGEETPLASESWDHFKRP